jgi:hypothetical protein
MVMLQRSFLIALLGVLSIAPGSADIFMRGNPPPPGCVETHCEEMWDDELGLPFRRCYWRCPRRRPQPEPRYVPDPPRYQPAPPPDPQVIDTAEASAEIPPEVLVLFGLLALVLIAGVVAHSSSKPGRAIDAALDDAARAAATKARLSAVIEEADALINQQTGRAYRRGRSGDGYE